MEVRLYIELQETSRDGGRNSSPLQLPASVDQLHQQLYAIHEVISVKFGGRHAQRTGGGVDGPCTVQTTLSRLTDVRPEDLR